MMPLDALSMAATSIDLDQVFNPELGVQERVLCYELYHKIRAMEEEKDEAKRASFLPARVQAELNKGSQLFLKKTLEEIYRAEGEILDWKVSESNPDLLIHQPGHEEYNLLVLEAKRAGENAGLMRYDLAKLALFSAEVLHYQYPVFLVFNEWGHDPRDAIAEMKQLGTQNGQMIHVLSLDIRNQCAVIGEVKFSIEAARDCFKEKARKKAEQRSQQQAEREALRRQEEGSS